MWKAKKNLEYYLNKTEIYFTTISFFSWNPGDGYTSGEELASGFDPNNKFSNLSLYYPSIMLTLLVATLTFFIIIIVLKKRYKTIILVTYHISHGLSYGTIKLKKYSLFFLLGYPP